MLWIRLGMIRTPSDLTTTANQVSSHHVPSRAIPSHSIPPPSRLRLTTPYNAIFVEHTSISFDHITSNFIPSHRITSHHITSHHISSPLLSSHLSSPPLHSILPHPTSFHLKQPNLTPPCPISTTPAPPLSISTLPPPWPTEASAPSTTFSCCAGGLNLIKLAAIPLFCSGLSSSSSPMSVVRGCIR